MGSFLHTDNICLKSFFIKKCPLWLFSLDELFEKKIKATSDQNTAQLLPEIRRVFMYNQFYISNCTNNRRFTNFCYKLPSKMIVSASLRHSPLFWRHCIGEFFPNRPLDMPPRKHGTPRVYNNHTGRFQQIPSPIYNIFGLVRLASTHETDRTIKESC